MNVRASADFRGSVTASIAMTNAQTGKGSVDMTSDRAWLRSTTRIPIRVYRVDRSGTVTQDCGTATRIRHGQEGAPATRELPPYACHIRQVAKVAQA